LSTLLTVRPFQRSDIPQIAELITELNKSEGYAHGMRAEQLEKVLAPDAPVRVYAFVAAEQGKLFGVLMYYDGYDTLSDSYGCHLMDLVVSEESRRKGIGKALVGALSAQVSELNYQWISLTVLKNNPAAKAFYASLGFNEIAVDFYAIGSKAMQRLVHSS
jgi:ribosomal protein S18 acetylase RimI-like enzyme